MYNISVGFNNETVSSFADYLKVSSSFNINNLEIGDSIDGFEITKLNGASIEEYRNALISSFKKIILLNTSKPVHDEDYHRKLFRQAHMLGVENIALNITENEINNSITNAVKTIVKIGKNYGIGVLFENNSATFLNKDKLLTEFYKLIKDENTGIIFNPLEYSKMKSHPFFHEYYNSKLKKEILILRINDGLFVDGSPALPGEGNAEIKEMVSILLSMGFKGYFSIMPYFKNMDLDRYNEVLLRLKKIFRSI